MDDASAPDAAGRAAREGGAGVLARALLDSRADTLATFDLYERHLPGLQVPQRPTLNPPLWELGHVGWFQQAWIGRNPQRERGWRADPLAPRHAAPRADADDLYDSMRVPHEVRWSLPLPDAQATRADLAAQLRQTLELLADAPAQDEALYFFRLALLHEDMHHEAALYMAQALGLPVEDPRWQCPVLPAPGPALDLPGGSWQLGGDPGPGFAFDNECGSRALRLAPARIDAQVLRWRDYLPFAEAGGYDDPRLWSPGGWRWRQAHGFDPFYLRRRGGDWLHWRQGRWEPLDLDEPACHLSFHEAQAWCHWAHRRLPSEAEWDFAAHTLGPRFRWGDVWEWTASTFTPFDGFVPHPYQAYSAPWFDGRPVLRGASFMTQPRMRHRRYRNFFEAGRCDVPAGFRTCAL